MYSIYYTPESEENVAEIFSYISDDNQFYAKKVLDKIKYSIDGLKVFPMLWKSIDWNKRLLVESNYKINIIYKVEWRNIYIISIFKHKNILF